MRVPKGAHFWESDAERIATLELLSGKRVRACEACALRLQGRKREAYQRAQLDRHGRDDHA